LQQGKNKHAKLSQYIAALENQRLQGKISVQSLAASANLFLSPKTTDILR